MPTLSFEGSVYYSTAVDRREKVVIAPSYTVTHLTTRDQTTILTGETHEVNFTDLPNNKCTNFFMYLTEGDVDVTIIDAASDNVLFQLTPSGMIIMMNTEITGLQIYANADSVYDLIAGG
jgi:hypothetical protein